MEREESILPTALIITTLSAILANRAYHSYNEQTLRMLSCMDGKWLSESASRICEPLASTAEWQHRWLYLTLTVMVIAGLVTIVSLCVALVNALLSTDE